MKNKVSQEYQVLISHPELSFSTESFSNIYATKKGKVKSIQNIDNWGIDEKEIELEHNQHLTSKYKGLWECQVNIGEVVEKGQIIAKTGDNRLYPTFSFQLLRDRVFQLIPLYLYQELEVITNITMNNIETR